MGLQQAGRALAVGLAAGAVLIGSPAWACSCIVEANVIPEVDDTEVPLEASLLVRWTADLQVAYTLVDLDAELTVPVTVERWTEAKTAWHRITPDLPLEPGVSYELRHSGEGDYWVAPELVRVIAVDAPADPPGHVTLSDLKSRYAEDGASCGEGGVLYGGVSVSGNDVGPVEVQVARSSSFDHAEVLTGSPRHGLWVGASTCLTNLAGLQDGEHVWLRARHVNLEGVAGPWSPAEEVVVGKGQKSGVLGMSCNTTQGSGLGLSLLPLLLVWCRRSRKS